MISRYGKQPSGPPAHLSVQSVRSSQGVLAVCQYVPPIKSFVPACPGKSPLPSHLSLRIPASPPAIYMIMRAS